MVTLVTAVTTAINVVLIPFIASIFGKWVTGGTDLSGIADTITGFFSKLF